MTEPSVQERIDLWRLAYSRATLLQAKGIAQVLLEWQARVALDHRIGLLTGLVVTYARPFTTTQVTKCQRIIPMHGFTIPAEHAEIHDTHMTMRHKVLGHKDATGPTTDDGLLNEVHFVLKGGFMDVHTVTPSHLAVPKLQETVILCDKLVALLDSRFNTLIEGRPFPRLQEGSLYALNIEDLSGPWIVKKRDEG